MWDFLIACGILEFFSNKLGIIKNNNNENISCTMQYTLYLAYYRRSYSSLNACDCLNVQIRP